MMLVPVMEDIFIQYGIDDIKEIEGIPGVWVDNQLGVNRLLESQSQSTRLQHGQGLHPHENELQRRRDMAAIPPLTNYKSSRNGGIGTTNCNT